MTDLHDAFAHALQPVEEKATVGWLIGTNTYQFDVAGRPGYIYVTITNPGQTTIAAVLNKGVPKSGGLPVLVKWSGAVKYVDGIDPLRAEAWFGTNPVPSMAGPHTHEFGGGLLDWVSTKRIRAFQTRFTSGLTVFVQPGEFVLNGTEGYFPGAGLLLSAPPTSGDFWWAKVVFDPNTNTISALYSSQTATKSDLTRSVLAAISLGGTIPLYGVIIQNGQTGASDETDQVDLRPWISGIGGSGQDATTTTVGSVLIDYPVRAPGIHPVALTLAQIAMAMLVAYLMGDGHVPSLLLPPPQSASITETSRWTRAPAAILTATAGWEGTAVVEPTTLFDNGTWKMWYRGGWTPAGIGLATCPGTSDPTVAANWTKYGSNPVIGGTAQQPTVIKVDDTYYIYYTTSAGNWLVATSSDGITWGSPSTALATTGAISRWANSTVWVENGNQWHALLEGFNASSRWEIHLATSSDGITWTQANSSNPLTSLRVHTGGAYGGPFVGVPQKFNGYYEVWYHAVNANANLPTDLYRAYSTDLINWTQYASNPVLTHSGTGFEIDQVADPEVREVNGKSYLFYDGDDNGSSSASIGVAYFNGPLSTLLAEATLPGNVAGPGAATDHAIARWDGITGALLEDSVPTVDDTGNINLHDQALQETVYVEYEETSTPASPDSGDQRVFIDTSDHHLKRVNSSGTVTDIEAGGTSFDVDTILTDEDGSVLVDENGNVLTE